MTCQSLAGFKRIPLVAMVRMKTLSTAGDTFSLLQVIDLVHMLNDSMILCCMQAWLSLCLPELCEGTI